MKSYQYAFSTRSRLCRAIQTAKNVVCPLQNSNIQQERAVSYAKLSEVLSRPLSLTQSNAIHGLIALNGGLCLYLGPSKICMPINVYCLPSATCPWDDIDRKNICLDQLRHLSPLRQAKQWLRTCSNEHDKCLPRAEALPTRLLDLKVNASRDVKLLNISDSKVAESMLCFFCIYSSFRMEVIVSGCRRTKLPLCLFEPFLGHNWMITQDHDFEHPTTQ